ncbi:MAG: YraN family protein [Candidatus Riflebacteria bacterium]|nr:YraN family protein [Candidatus Riflebacteria bacterium]
MGDPRQALGQRGEALAARFLEGKGMGIVARNVRTRYGELDLVARDRDTLVFVEVRARTHVAHGDPLETVTRGKQAKLIRMARWYLAANRVSPDVFCRFDVIGIVCLPGQEPVLTHVENAFGS